MNIQSFSLKSIYKVSFFLLLIGVMLSSLGINRVSTVSAQDSAADKLVTHKLISESSLATTDLSHRYIIFLDGVNTSAPGNNGENVFLQKTFGSIIDKLGGIGLSPSRFIYFSYSAANYSLQSQYCSGWKDGCSTTSGGDLTSLNLSPIYVEKDTHLPIIQQSWVLEWLINQILIEDKDPSVQIDLIGFSLGGLVASYWGSHDSPLRSHIHGIIAIESPLGGIPLAAQCIDSSDPLFCYEIISRFGIEILRELQLPDIMPDSIVDELPNVARNNFKFTSIQSTTDYIVNDLPILVDFGIAGKWQIPVGKGSQDWKGTQQTLHADNLGGNLTTSYIPLENVDDWINTNHRAPLGNDQTSRWIIEALQIVTPPTNAVDVALIIDSSGSMSSNDPGNKRLLAARAYLTASLAGDYVGVVDFDSSARLASPLLRLPENKTSLVNAINTIDSSSGGTNIGIGVQEGCNALKNSTSGNAIKAAILLTDGRGSFNHQDSCFRDRGWAIYTFGFGSANDALLQEIASTTGGEFARLPTSDFVCEFLRVRSKIAGIEPGPCSSTHIGPLETLIDITKVPLGQKQVSFSTSWAGSDIEMTLRSPSGRVVDRNTIAPDVIHDLGATFEVYTILNPEPGDWEVRLFGLDVPAGGEDVIFSFTNIPSTTEQSTSTSVNPTNAKVGDTATVTVSLNSVPAEGGYTSAEFTCTYDESLLEVSNIKVGTLFGADVVSAINGPQGGNFIVAIAGSNGNKATTSGAAFTFDVKALHAGQASVKCTARVSKGDGNIISLPSTGPATLTIGGGTITPTFTPMPTGSTTPTATATFTETPTPSSTSTPTDTPTPSSTPTATASVTPSQPLIGTLTGQVLATEPVIVRLYDATNTLTASIPANPDGTFSLTAPAGTYTVVASASGFLSAQGSVTITGGNAATLPTINLLAGDIDNNNVIDQFDAMTIGMNYNTVTPSAADLNNDGIINILDLELLAKNYRMIGPVPWQ